ncbi:MAG: hypothetical protein ACHQRM_12800 [Bacteroidia bacterium]
MRKFYVLLSLFFLIPFLASAQQKNLPLNYEGYIGTDRLLTKKKNDGFTTFTAVKPIVESTTLTYQTYICTNSLGNIDSRECFPLCGMMQNDSNKAQLEYYGYSKRHYTNWKAKLEGKIKYDHLIVFADSATRFHMTIDPLLNFEFGKDQEDKTGRKLSVNTRGFLIQGDIGTHFSFGSSFFENQAFVPHYLDSVVRATQVMPGQGRWKDFKKGGYDYSMSSGYVSYSPNKHFNIQGGNGKHFIGDGYRSLLLSDNSFNYPYLRITTTYGRFQYTNLYASLMNLTFSSAHIPAGTEHLYQKKSAALQFLNVNVCKRVQLGVFQALIATAADSTNRQHLDFYYFQPVIGVSAAHYGFNEPNHVLMGATIKVKVCSYFSLYGQYMLDGIAQSYYGGGIYNRQGFQAGGKLFDFCRIKNLYLQGEYNQVRPYSYTAADPAQSYTHYGQALADPLGANFREFIGIIHYKFRDFFVEAKANYARIGADSTGKFYGQNVFASDNLAWLGSNQQNVPLLQGLKSTLTIGEFKFGYMINPAYNMNIMIGAMIRDYHNSLAHEKTNYIYFGLRTSLTNMYYDF